MDIRRLKKLIAQIPARNSTNAYKYIVVATDAAKAEINLLVAKLPEEERKDLVVITEAENANGGMGLRSSGYNGQHRVSGWEGSTYDYAAENGEIV